MPIVYYWLLKYMFQRKDREYYFVTLSVTSCALHVNFTEVVSKDYYSLGIVTYIEVSLCVVQLYLKRTERLSAYVMK